MIALRYALHDGALRPWRWELSVAFLNKVTFRRLIATTAIIELSVNPKNGYRSPAPAGNPKAF
ncbi:hypothetical protein [Pelagicoccus sp. SDUM812003]|uniref:hypothetical protein n=1 Tax=Pelagicoccus sp. SDUM812003 TaxID=3041267 RepID=UPI00280F9BF5|nr:hypothetical protein [Pelagicoccus sp. SDUM812003]MDQ8204723.1 hypothetical protein [Pelagicoccus sp. SDUM812003]